MRTLIQSAALAALTLAGPAAQATDFAPLMDTAHTIWPEKTHIGVVANYGRSRDEIALLARAAGEGCSITVMDIKGVSQIEKVSHILRDRIKPDYLVLLPHDPLVWDGSFNATRLVGLVAHHGIPTVGTTPKVIEQGAVFAMGPETGFEPMVARRMIGTVEVILPQKGRYVNKTSSLPRGMAEISVVGRF